MTVIPAMWEIEVGKSQCQAKSGRPYLKGWQSFSNGRALS
jgi:hypothetical protein